MQDLLRDLEFGLYEASASGEEDDTGRALLREAARWSARHLCPIDGPSDRQGAIFDAERGTVAVPEQWHAAYRSMSDAGWRAVTKSCEWGGQGLSEALGLAIREILMAGCLAFYLHEPLSTGVGSLIETHGTERQKQVYLRKLYCGSWAATMCLTEPSAGSDLAAIRTKAVRSDSGFCIEGSKTFITFGDHDLTHNIVHAVLARIDGAPRGQAGLSLFLVPKFRVDDGAPNGVCCGGLETKLGLHGSPTCTIHFGSEQVCQGELLGAEGRGLVIMQDLMAEARLAVGLQGVALGGAAYRIALGYARERQQGRSLLTGAPAAIIEHPDVRRMLLWQKALTEGTRGLLLRTARWCDLAQRADSAEARVESAALAHLMTPVCKAFASDAGFRTAELAMQTLGGYGYVEDYGIAQILRDVKIASIYEGTNGIQALDLIWRRLPADDGAAIKALDGMMARTASTCERLNVGAAHLRVARDAVLRTATELSEASGSRRLLPMVEAVPFLRLLGSTLVGWVLLDAASVAMAWLTPRAAAVEVDLEDAEAVARWADGDEDVRFYASKVTVARFYAARALALIPAQADVLIAGDPSPLRGVL